MKNLQRGAINSVLIIVVVIILLVVGGFYIINNNKKPIQEIKNTDTTSEQSLPIVLSPQTTTSNSAQDEAKNNKIIVGMMELRVEGEVLYSQENSYKKICNNGYINEQIAGLKKVVDIIKVNKNTTTQELGGVKCVSSDKDWNITVALVGGNTWCKRDPTTEGVGVKYCANGKGIWGVSALGIVGLK